MEAEGWIDLVVFKKKILSGGGNNISYLLCVFSKNTLILFSTGYNYNGHIFGRMLAYLVNFAYTRAMIKLSKLRPIIFIVQY